MKQKVLLIFVLCCFSIWIDLNSQIQHFDATSLGYVRIAPTSTSSGNASELLFGEDNDATYGMKFRYDGSIDKLLLYGKINTTFYGPHLTIYRSNPTKIGIGTTSPQATLDVNGNLYTTGGGIKILGSTHLIFANSTAHGVIDFGGSGNGNLYFRSLDVLGNINNYNDLMIITYDGHVGIGTNSPGTYKLAVDGSIHAKSVDVEAIWSDFVFDDNYDLMPLENVRSFIEINNHLPNIPSAKEVEKDGINVGEMQSKLLQKIEELTLYIIQVSDENVALKNRIDALENEINSSKDD